MDHLKIIELAVIFLLLTWQSEAATSAFTDSLSDEEKVEFDVLKRSCTDQQVLWLMRILPGQHLANERIRMLEQAQETLNMDVLTAFGNFTASQGRSINSLGRLTRRINAIAKRMRYANIL